MKSNNRKTRGKPSPGPPDARARATVEPPDQAGDAAGVPHIKPSADVQELPGTPGRRSPRQEEYGTVPEQVARVRRRPHEDDDDDAYEYDDDDEDDEDEGGDDGDTRPDGDDSGGQEAEHVPALTVPNDSPDVRGFLRSVLTDSVAAHALADYLVEAGDPRGEHVRHLVMAPLVLPPIPRSWRYDVIVVATEQWVVRLQKSRIEGRAYPTTPFARAVARWGGPEKRGVEPVAVHAPPGGWTREAVGAALDRVRRRVVYGLFGTTEAEVRCPPEGLMALRVRRLVQLSRSYRGVESVYATVRGDPNLRDAALASLAKKGRDHDAWAELMDLVNPGWRRQFTSKRAK